MYTYSGRGLQKFIFVGGAGFCVTISVVLKCFYTNGKTRGQQNVFRTVF